VQTLIKEKKEKENVLTNLELINLKSVSLLNFEKFRRRIAKVEIRNWWRQIRSIRGIYSSCRHSWRLQMRRKKVWTQLVGREGWRIMNRCYSITF
jgi:hypothetical protein